MFKKQAITIYPIPTFAISLICFALLAVFVQPNLGKVILFFDNGDLFDPKGYFSQSIWVDNLLVAYKDYIVESPPMGLYTYSLPRIFFNISTEQEYLYAFTFIALFPIFITFYLLLRRQPRLALFLCTPSFFYYSLCRFDIFPALASLIAILFILDKKHYLGAIILGLAIGMKWYAVVLILPLLALQDNKIKWLSIVILSSLIFCFHHIFYVGFENALSTYTFHTGRGTNKESFLYLIIHYRWNNHLPDLLKHIFFILQFLPSLIVAMFLYKHKIKATQEVISLSAIISILSFILFAKYFSAQWLLWLIPFVVLLGDKKIIGFYLVMDILNYILTITSSVLYSSTSSYIFDLFTLSHVLLSIIIIYLATKKLQQQSRQQFYNNDSTSSNSGLIRGQSQNIFQIIFNCLLFNNFIVNVKSYSKLTPTPKSKRL
jgi:hypothetical protein